MIVTVPEPGLGPVVAQNNDACISLWEVVICVHDPVPEKVSEILSCVTAVGGDTVTHQTSSSALAVGVNDAVVWDAADVVEPPEVRLVGLLTDMRTSMLWV